MVYKPDNLGSQLFDARMKAHDVLQEHLKQVITIASATLALTVSFLKDVVGSEGERATWAKALPLSWICLGASIAFAIWAIAVLVNNLDWPTQSEQAKPPSGGEPITIDRSYAAGAKLRSSVPVFLSFAAFAIGMASLGVFAAKNHDLLLRRVKREYQIGSAVEAVERAKSNLPKDAVGVQVTKVELIKGVRESPPDGQVWHVQLQYETVMKTPASEEGKATSSTGRSRKPVRPLRRTSAHQPMVPQSKSIMANFFLDAKTGETTRVP